MSIEDGNLTEDRARSRLIWLVITFVSIALGILVVFMFDQPAAIAGVTVYERQVRGHDVNVTVPAGARPPVGGVHSDLWQNCGIYTEPIPAAQALHSMEHGAVWITYRPDLPAEAVAELQTYVVDQDYLLLSPYPGQHSPIVLTAWSVQLELESAQDERIPAFVSRYRLGPTVPERGAACAGGAGEPLD